MDFEEQLEKAERLPTPSLVGSSIRSADDSAHNNYIHPEKSKGKKKEKTKGHGILNQSIAASLDDLMREGALLGSEEDFEEVLDNSGNIKEDAKYAGENDHTKKKTHLRTLAAAAEGKSGDASTDGDDKSGKPEDEKTENGDKNTVLTSNKNVASLDNTDKKVKSEDQNDDQEDAESSSKTTAEQEKNSGVSFYNQENYSTPNLSEYQLDHQINDHKDLLSNIQSYDPHRLPSSQSDYVQNDDNSYFKRPVSPSKRTPTSVVNQFNDDVTIAAGATDGLHTPYFQRDSRSQSRSGASRQDRSRSRSAIAPHLARGDSYKNTNIRDPSAYELPPGLAASEIKSEDEEEDETQERRSRQSKPTMGESIAAAEASKELLGKSLAGVSMQRDASLVTTGDYTNFDVDKPEPQVQDSSNLYSTRSASSTNYLRSISRSRSRQPDKDLRASNLHNEKNDADPEELFKGGALINEDPYSTIGGLDTMVEEVLHPGAEKSEVSETKPELEVKSDNKDIAIKKNDTNKEPQTTDKEDKQAPKGDNEDININDDTTNDLPSKSQTKVVENDNQAEENDKEGANDIDSKAIEQIELSLEPKDLVVNKAQSLHSDDIHGDSSEATTRLADSIITEDKEDKADIKSDKDNLDSAAIDQIESSIDAKNDIIEQGESLTAEDIHVKDEADQVVDDTNTDDKKDKDDKEENVNTAGIEKIESSINSKDSVAEVAEPLTSKDINVESEGTKVTEDAAEKKATSVNSAEDEKEEDANEDAKEKDAKEEEVSKDGKLVEQIESDDVSGNIKSIITDKFATESTSEAESAIQDDVTVKEEANKNDEDDKAVEQIEYSVDSKDEVAEKAKPLTADDIVTDSSSKSVTGDEGKEETASEKDLDGKTTSQVESSDIAEKHESLTASDTSTDTSSKATSKDLDEKKDEKTELENSEESKVKEDSTSKDILAGSTKEAAVDDDLSDIDISPEELRKHLESQPVYIYTSLAGGMQVMTRTNRLTTILTANGIKFEYRDLGTDEEAKKIWRRQANGKTLPGVVRGDDYIGNWQEVDEANEEYRLREILYETL